MTIGPHPVPLALRYSLPPCGGGLGRGVRCLRVVCRIPPSLSLPLKGGEDARVVALGKVL